MRVVHLSCVAPPYHGGIGRVAFEEVSRLRARGIDASMLSPVGGGDAQLIKRMPVRLNVGVAAFPLYPALQEDLASADIVHLHYPFYGTAGFVAKLRREQKIKKLVLTLHMDATASGVKGLMFETHRRLAQSRILNSADILIASSRDYVAHSSFASWAERVVELPFGVDQKQIHKKDNILL